MTDQASALVDELVERIVQQVGCPLPCMGYDETRKVYREIVTVVLGHDDRHIVDLREDGWTIRHPLSCRPNLFNCPVNKAAERDLTEPPAELGRFVCGLDDDGRFIVCELTEGPADAPDSAGSAGAV